MHRSVLCTTTTVSVILSVRTPTQTRSLFSSRALQRASLPWLDLEGAAYGVIQKARGTPGRDLRISPATDL